MGKVLNSVLKMVNLRCILEIPQKDSPGDEGRGQG